MARMHRHPETRDVRPRALLAFGGGLLAFIALTAIGAKLVFSTTPGWLPVNTNAGPQSPDLQAAPKQDLAAFRAQEDRQLDMLAWVDRKAGIVRIPIDDAMRGLVSNGLPDWSHSGAAVIRPGNCALLTAAVPRTPQSQDCQRQSGAGR